MGGGERLPATHMGSLLINTREESHPSWLFTVAGRPQVPLLRTTSGSHLKPLLAFLRREKGIPGALRETL